MAVVSKAATPAQTVLETTLGTVVADVAAARPEPPALMVLGSVVALRSRLDWWQPG